ncbi:MAG: hypothetical protein NVSMB16_02040 [Acidimicrobiales bacterium]
MWLRTGKADMYLYSRRVVLGGKQLRAGQQWAGETLAAVNAVAAAPMTLWAEMFGPQVGSMVFSSFFDDLDAFAALGQAVAGSDEVTQQIESGIEFTVGQPRDALREIVAGATDQTRNIQYVLASRGIIADGHVAEAIRAGVELRDRAEKITGAPVVFAADTFGQYGGVVWLGGCETIAEIEAANHALASDASWTEFIDHDMAGKFLDAPGASTQTLLHRIA